MISAKSIEQAYQVLKDVVVETSLVFDQAENFWLPQRGDNVFTVAGY